MCEKKPCCEKPENLESKPAECSPEQVRKCHGASSVHPCCASAHDPETKGQTS